MLVLYTNFPCNELASSASSLTKFTDSENFALSTSMFLVTIQILNNFFRVPSEIKSQIPVFRQVTFSISRVHHHSS